MRTKIAAQIFGKNLTKFQSPTGLAGGARDLLGQNFTDQFFQKNNP